MAASNQPRSKARKPADDKTKLEAAAEAVEPSNEQEIGPAVVVYRDAEGQPQVALMNGIDPLVAPSLLSLGLKAIKEQLGID
jgi:hypothetical protein